MPAIICISDKIIGKVIGKVIRKVKEEVYMALPINITEKPSISEKCLIQYGEIILMKENCLCCPIIFLLTTV